MATTKMVYWQEDECWLGYLEEFPDYWTQGETLDDLKQHLRDVYADLTGPCGGGGLGFVGPYLNGVPAGGPVGRRLADF